jgi:tetratricopeptide (TPR) repeat protein
MAFEMLRKLEVQIPHDSQILYRLAYLYEQRGESEQAMVLYERARQEDPLLTVATVNLANQLAVRKRLAEALSLWKTALAQNPALEEARINLAIALAQSGRLNEAHAALSTALEYNPDSPAVGRVLDTLKQLK